MQMWAFLFSFYICSSVWYVCMCVCVNTGVLSSWVHVCTRQRLMSDVFLAHSPLLRQGLSLNLELPAGQLTLGSTSHGQTLQAGLPQLPALLCGCWGSRLWSSGLIHWAISPAPTCMYLFSRYSNVCHGRPGEGKAQSKGKCSGNEAVRREADDPCGTTFMLPTAFTTVTGTKRFLLKEGWGRTEATSHLEWPF